MKSLLTFLVLLFTCSELFCISISNVKLDPASPAKLTIGDMVTIKFQYNIKHPLEVKIVYTPLINGNHPAQYSTSGFPICKGSGQSTVKFSIDSIVESTVLTVNQIKFKVISTRNRNVLFEFHLPVKYQFSKPAMVLATPMLEVFEIKPYNRALLNERYILGRKNLIRNDSLYVGIKKPPKIDSLKVLCQQVPYATPPYEPESLDSLWEKNLNMWIIRQSFILNEHFLRVILEEEDFSDYHKDEDDLDLNPYQELEYRVRFIEKLFNSD